MHQSFLQATALQTELLERLLLKPEEKLRPRAGRSRSPYRSKERTEQASASNCELVARCIRGIAAVTAVIVLAYLCVLATLNATPDQPLSEKSLAFEVEVIDSHVQHTGRHTRLHGKRLEDGRYQTRSGHVLDDGT
jgi:hypothetical protein